MRRLVALCALAALISPRPAHAESGCLPAEAGEVVSGLVDVPVIGLPTPVGYGKGGAGEAALLSMLQTCAPGMAVVNIGNGIGAGAIAGLIANRLAAARLEEPQEAVHPD